MLEVGVERRGWRVTITVFKVQIFLRWILNKKRG